MTLANASGIPVSDDVDFILTPQSSEDPGMWAVILFLDLTVLKRSHDFKLTQR